MAKKKRKLKSRGTAEYKVCSHCGTENNRTASECINCEKSRFEPDWVAAHRPLNRQFSVQITSSNPQFGDVEKRITLSKWWPGGRTFFHFPKASQWEKVAAIINNDLGPKLGWETAAQLVKSATTKGAATIAGKKDIAKLAKDHPDFLKELISAINLDKFSTQDFNSIVETFGQISDVLTNANAGFREAYLAIVKKLPEQKQRALEDLSLLLEGWSLNVVTNVAQQVKARLNTIDLFEKQIEDSRTFEIQGDSSIHRILERAMWLVDEEYWLLHSNRTLRMQIGKEISKQDAKLYGKKRPDFVCGTIGNRLIILELKRPGHELNITDMNQLETYLAVAKKYSKFGSAHGYLVGSLIDEELERRLEFRKGCEILFYANIIDSTKKRYHEFLKTLDN
jgi:hypothetical protein